MPKGIRKKPCCHSISKDGEIMTLKVCMFVYNNFKHDSRVLKEAKTLADAGYDVRVIAVLDKTTEPYEERDGFRVIRVVKNPFHYKVLRAMKPPLRFLNPLSYILVRLRWKLPDRCSVRLKGNKLDKLAGKWVRAIRDYMYRCAGGVFPRRIRRCAKVIYKYIKKALHWVIYRSVKQLRSFFYDRLKCFLMLFHKPLSFLDYYHRALQLVKEEPADIYHAHDLNTLPVAYWAKRKTGGKLVYDSHELYVERNTPKKQSRFAKFLLSKTESFLVKPVAHVITVSESIGEELKRRYPIKQLSVILNVPLCHIGRSALSLRDELSIPECEKIVIYVGNIIINRGLEELIQSIVYLDHCVVVMMGRASNPAYSQKLKQLAGDVGVENKVYYFGPVPQKDVIVYTSSADIGAAPSKNACLSYYYSAPNKLFECIAAGLPVVGSNLPEFKKVIEGYRLGKTFNPDKPEDIAEAVNYVLSDKDRYDEMKRNALRAAKVFNWENESKKLLEIYKKLGDELSITSN